MKNFLVQDITEYTHKKFKGNKKKVCLILVQEDPKMGPWSSEKPTYDEKHKTFYLHMSVKKFKKHPVKKGDEISLGNFTTYTKEYKPIDPLTQERKRDENGKKVKIKMTYIKEIG